MTTFLTLLTAIVCWGLIYFLVRRHKPSMSSFLNGTLRVPEAKAGKASALIGALLALIPLWMFFVAWPFVVAFAMIDFGGRIPVRLFGDTFRVLWALAPVAVFIAARRRNVPAPYLVSVVVAAGLSLLVSAVSW